MNLTNNSCFNKPHQTYERTVADFKETLDDGVYDYWTIQFMWATYVDDLCKRGKISQRQYDEWETPFEEGKHVYVYQKQVVSQTKPRRRFIR